MSEDDDPNTPGEQGRSIGVIHTREYPDYQGLPPDSGVWTPPLLAIVDEGFALDGDGRPLNDNRDYFRTRPDQIDVIDGDFNAGGNDGSGSWHGQQVFAIFIKKLL